MAPVDKERQAVVVGVGRYTQRINKSSIEQRLSPVGLSVEAARRASLDTGLCSKDAEKLLKDVVGVATVSMFYEQRWKKSFKKKPFKNFTRTVADSIGANPSDELCWKTLPFGNSPQWLITQFASLIAKGEIDQGPILIGGAEANGSFDSAKRGKDLEKLVAVKNGWCDDENAPKTSPKIVNGPERGLPSAVEVFMQNIAHGLQVPLLMYPMFENAYRREKGVDLQSHMHQIGDLLHRFSVVAAAQPEHSWYPIERSIHEIVEVTEQNRMIGYPYTKNMVARDEVDQSAMILVMSWAEAERRGISRDKLVFLWSSGDAYDLEITALRHEYGKSLSMRAAYAEAFRKAGMDITKPADVDRIKVFDFYSCFSIAVEQACDTLGLDSRTLDVSRITATGGLPYHGGPGGNYSAHGLCGLVEKLRTDYFRGELGMLCANGGMLTEHSVGIYSTNPPVENFSMRDHNEYAASFGVSDESYALAPNGKGKILTWTVEYEKKPNIPSRGIIIGEMTSGNDKGKRFCANTRKGDTKTMQWMLEKCRIGEEVSVECTGEEKQRVGPMKVDLVRFSMLPASAI
mmetsp:Transcript_12063/g.13874  ORF Transcript_12063/g.13874 Transcript_12063/m.13874 type:complete len:573 (+) Transcript_12063:112-1830(+)|eukprot:CAMPEP_0184030632 /NCGR_PEP_ID=MMETSP0955-20130417/1615_1 /TAXON_ID=627963 /ORGANISM="Aplanochytrium sp, Strain PBS07" /LENGTH=572 /DNA_ID=CAMNT_0026316115 /DNA_START=94 /DNA_END=1812 /DNA_ORIENTATION=+